MNLSWRSVFVPILFCVGCLTGLLPQARSVDIVFEDFEHDSYGEWKVEGTAFDVAPSHGTHINQQRVSGFEGQRLVNTYVSGTGDNAVGRLTSPEFTIKHDYISFLIGGGEQPEHLRLELIVDDKPVRTATGNNEEALNLDFWAVADFKGKTAHIEIVDDSRRQWGHINVDQIVFTDTKPAPKFHKIKETFIATKKWLALPVKNGAPRRHVEIWARGKKVRWFDIDLAEGTPDWTAYLDISEWKNQQLELRVNRMLATSTALNPIIQTDEDTSIGTMCTAPLYDEPMRGQFHFSPRHGWMNDPNGLVYYKGEYHLFFQHNPYLVNAGASHWGHAVSKDLVHWKQLGIALYPDEYGLMYSGGGVVDWKNTSGYGTPENPPLAIFYTAATSWVQGAAFSIDGRTFKKHPAPVVPKIQGDNRDPKVIWHEPTKKWVIILWLWDPEKKQQAVQFLTSPDMKKWTPVSRFWGGKGKDRFLYECPEFFEVAVDGNEQNKKWVLCGANSAYAYGTFDGEKFTAEEINLNGQRGPEGIGNGYYAAQLFSDEPAGRRIEIGWLFTQTHGKASFNSSASLPMEVSLKTTPRGIRLVREPIAELNSLRAKTHNINIKALSPGGVNPLAGINAELLEVRAEFAPEQNSAITFNIRGVSVVYDTNKEEISVNGLRATAPLSNGKLDLIIYIDRNVIEVFAGEGELYIPLPHLFDRENNSLSVETKNGPAAFSVFTVYELKSAWK